MKLLANLKAIDAQATKVFGMPGTVLMENAGRSVAEAILSEAEINGVSKAPSVLILCGPGNNGGDGFVCARQLIMRGLSSCTVLTTLELEAYQDDAAVNASLLKHFPIRVIESPAVELVHNLVQQADIVVDALFGSGLSRPIDGEVAEWVISVNQSNAKVVSIDTPSGIHPYTGQCQGETIQAHKTITFQVAKPGLYLYPGRSYAGQIETVCIGLPPKLIDEAQPSAQLIEPALVESMLPKRTIDSHKYTFGNTLVVGGNGQMPGAPLMTAEAALTAGCGYVRLASSQAAIERMQLIPELVVFPVEGSQQGALSISDMDALTPLLNLADVLALGPGLGRTEGTQTFVEAMIVHCLNHFKGVVVIDADALNALSQVKTTLTLNHRFVLTPHLGEASRLLKTSVQEVKADMIAAAKALVETYQCAVVLKSASTVVAGPSEECIQLWINPTGDSGLATAGSGDILTGFIAGQLAQLVGQKENLDAKTVNQSVAAVTYLHGLSGQLASQTLTPYAVTAMSLLEYFPQALKHVIERAPLPPRWALS